MWRSGGGERDVVGRDGGRVSGSAEPRRLCRPVCGRLSSRPGPERPARWCVGRWRLSAAGGGERFELLEGGDELGRPRPGVVEVELRAAAGERETTGDVQQAVAQPLGFGLGQLAVEDECLGPDERFSCASAGYKFSLPTAR